MIEDGIEILEGKLEELGCIIHFFDNGYNPLVITPDSILKNPPHWFYNVIRVLGYDIVSKSDYGICDWCDSLICFDNKDFIVTKDEVVCYDCVQSWVSCSSGIETEEDIKDIYDDFTWICTVDDKELDNVEKALNVSLVPYVIAKTRYNIYYVLADNTFQDEIEALRTILH